MRTVRKNVEKWCDFCGDGRDKQWADDWAIIDQTHTEHLVTILFCPMCGRQLTEGLEVANENPAEWPRTWDADELIRG